MLEGEHFVLEFEVVKLVGPADTICLSQFVCLHDQLYWVGIVMET